MHDRVMERFRIDVPQPELVHPGHLDRTGLPERVEVPTAVSIFLKDTVPAPREFAERWFDVRRWTEMPRGGHFAAWEEPELLADDLIAFFGSSDTQ
jgi:pimeloyl-ACP methyl ester carboxylesterase